MSFILGWGENSRAEIGENSLLGWEPRMDRGELGGLCACVCVGKIETEGLKETGEKNLQGDAAGGAWRIMGR